MDESIDTNDLEPANTEQLTGLGGFLQSLAGYYARFLETDFKKQRQPKRKFESRDRNGNRLGLRTEKYPELRKLLLQKLEQKTNASFLIRPRTYSSSLPTTTRGGIDAAINRVDTTAYHKDLNALSDWLKQQRSDSKIGLEEVRDEALEILTLSTRNHVVEPVLDLVSPVLEKSIGARMAVDHLIVYADEITANVIQQAEILLSEVIPEILIQNMDGAFEDLVEQSLTDNHIQSTLRDWFSSFAVSDAHAELREIISTQLLKEETEVYLNFAELEINKVKFPLYFVPVQANFEKDNIRVEFGSHLFVNKKAVDYLVGEIGKRLDKKIPSAIEERILYKKEDQTYLELAEESFYKVLMSLQVQGDLDLGGLIEGQAVGPGPIFVNNSITLSLSDKSDESIINDYESLMTGIDLDSGLLDAFRGLVASFLTENPDSVERELDQEWDDLPTEKRLVFETPLPLAEEQRKILSAVRNPAARFILLEGPPGTGKSHTIAAIASELILHGKNILILSDKTEALNVAEDKINSVIKKVRGLDVNFVNPILRLGKTDGNFANIVKNSSIEKIKTSVKTFSKQEQAFNKTVSSLEEELKANISQRIETAKSIEIDDIDKLFTLEEELSREFPKFSEEFFGPSDRMEVLAEFYLEFLLKNRELVASFGESLDGVKEIKMLLSLIEILQNEDNLPRDIAEKYPKLDLTRASELQTLAYSIEQLRKPLFGYLWQGKKLSALRHKIRNITNEHFDKPQQHLYEIRHLSTVGQSIENALRQYGQTTENASFLYQVLGLGFTPSADDSELLKDYVLNLEGLEDLGVAYTPKALLGMSSTDALLLRSFDEAFDLKEALTNKFDDIPDFDYLKDKNQFETFQAQKLTQEIDKRVVEFAISKKADAKELLKIIKNKEKFPVDKFEVLKDAFPCMIAGLRDYAEFIPLKEELFDLIIIDEASQVSIAQALPAMLRCKKMLVMGDRKQFGNVKTSNASKELNKAYFMRVEAALAEAIDIGELPKNSRGETLNVTNSVMEFFDYISNFTVQLRKHFRSYPEMISFSHKYFYENLQMLKIRGVPINDVLEFVELPDADRFELTRNVNAAEADYIFSRLEELLKDLRPHTVAIITPFREQQQYLQRRLSDHKLRDDLLHKLDLAVFTFDTCQGEERETIFYSMVGTRQSDQLNYIFPRDLRDSSAEEMDGALRFQRLNVGFSRGQEKLVFVLSKPVEEYKNAIGQALSHYAKTLDDARLLPNDEGVDASSPMESRVLGWLKSTSFVNLNNELEIIPKFELGRYLKSLDESYEHPFYKIDFLLRLKEGGRTYQVIVEYDGFEHHFKNKDRVDASNWRHYLTDGDVERECILEGYGYKMLRINRFNIGKDPISTLDQRLTDLFQDLSEAKTHHKKMSDLQEETEKNITGLENKTHKECSGCNTIKSMNDFRDSTLKNGFGRLCLICKNSKTGEKIRARKARRRGRSSH